MLLFDIHYANINLIYCLNIDSISFPMAVFTTSNLLLIKKKILNKLRANKGKKTMNFIERIKPLVEEIAFKKVEIDEPLYTSNLIDSMGTVDLAMMLEEEFNIKIDTRDIIESNFDSLTKLADYIKSRVSE